VQQHVLGAVGNKDLVGSLLLLLRVRSAADAQSVSDN